MVKSLCDAQRSLKCEHKTNLNRDCIGCLYTGSCKFQQTKEQAKQRIDDVMEEK